MSDFKAKMYQIQFQLGLRPRPLGKPLGELTALPRPSSWIKGPTSKGRGGDGKVRRGGERGDETPPLHAPLIHISGYAPAFYKAFFVNCLFNSDPY